MFSKYLRLVSLVTTIWLLSSLAAADSGRFQSGWVDSGGITFQNSIGHSSSVLYASTLRSEVPEPQFVVLQRASTFQIRAGDLPFRSGNQYYDAFVTKFCAVPEPSSLVLLGTGLAGLATLVRRKFRRA